MVAGTVQIVLSENVHCGRGVISLLRDGAELNTTVLMLECSFVANFLCS